MSDLLGQPHGGDVPAPARKGNARSSGYELVEHEWYVEPRWAVDALLDREIFHGPVFDPACGSGNIPQACLERGIGGSGIDIEDRGYGRVQDFLTMELRPTYNVITNPPFKLATEFTLRAIDITAVGGKVCILQKLSWLEGSERGRRLFDQGNLERVWVFRKRVSMPPGGKNIKPTNGSVAYGWFVFRPGQTFDAPRLGWIV